MLYNPSVEPGIEETAAQRVISKFIFEQVQIVSRCGEVEVRWERELGHCLSAHMCTELRPRSTAKSERVYVGPGSRQKVV